MRKKGEEGEREGEKRGGEVALDFLRFVVDSCERRIMDTSAHERMKR